MSLFLTAQQYFKPKFYCFFPVLFQRIVGVFYDRFLFLFSWSEPNTLSKTIPLHSNGMDNY